MGIKVGEGELKKKQLTPGTNLQSGVLFKQTHLTHTSLKSNLKTKTMFLFQPLLMIILSLFL